MANPSSAGGSNAARLVERQLRNWELARSQRAAPASAQAPATPPVEFFISISRTVGAGGGQLAERLGARLGWPVVDKLILQEMAGDDALRVRLYEHLDERDTTWIESVLRWLLQGEFRKDDYFHRLSESVLAIARQGHAIFLGRGADLILPRQAGLRVRLDRQLDQRIARYAQRRNISMDKARGEVARIDAERADFIRNHFAVQADSLSRYDMHFNTDHLTSDEAADAVLAVLRARGLKK